MVDAIASIPVASGSFDTALLQIARAQAQAVASSSNIATFLREFAKINEEANAHALESVPTPAEAFFSSSLLNVDPSQDLALNPAIAPSTDPASLVPFAEFTSDAATVNSDSSKAQQMHDLAVLQRDAFLLEEAANEDHLIPLGSGASTVDLSPEAQSLVSGETIVSTDVSAPPTTAQLAEVALILRPLANQPLTADLLRQIQARLTSLSPIELNLSTMALAMHVIAGMQPSSNHVIENRVAQTNNKAITPVSAIDKVAVEDSAIQS